MSSGWGIAQNCLTFPKEFTLADGRCFRILVVVDDFSREWLCLAADTSISGARAARELDAIVGRRGKPMLCVSDNGTELTSTAILRRCQEPVRTFRTFTDDLHRLADWFAGRGIKTVVMESTGVNWIPVFEILEQRGFEVMVVNARDAKHVPGRKTDVSDAEWLQRLHEYGLLRASFRPQAQLPGCAPIFGNVNGCWITRRRTSSTCKRR